MEIFVVKELAYFYKINNFNSIFLTRKFNKFLFLSETLTGISLLNTTLRAFTRKKVFARDFDFKSYNIDLLYSGFLFSNLFFFKSYTNKAFCLVSYSKIKQYKCILKLIIKNNSHLDCLSLIKLLNYNILRWFKDFRFVSFYNCLALDLDFYLYKLLWKWVKRFHPRRPNSWIFTRYWKNLSGCFKFFSINPLTGKSFFLFSHKSSVSCVVKQKLSCKLSTFEFLDKEKLIHDYFKSLRTEFLGVYGILFDSQKGICPGCNRRFSKFDLNHIRIFYVSNSTSRVKSSLRLVLVHDSCSILFSKYF